MFSIEFVEKVKIEIVEKYSNHSTQELMHVVLLEFHLLNIKIDKIMSTQKDEAQILADLALQITSWGPAIKALEDAASGQENASPELDAAVQGIKAAAKGVSDILNPPAEVPVTPPTEAPAEPAAPAESEGTDATATE